MVSTIEPDGPSSGISSRIRARRLALGYSQPELAGLAGIDKAVISRLESGKSASSRHLHRIAAALEVPTSFLLDGESPKSLDWQPHNTKQMITPAPRYVSGAQEDFILLELIKQDSPAGPSIGPKARIPFPKALLPPTGELALLALSPSLHLVIDTAAAIEDGRVYAMRWQGSHMQATVFLDADGITLRRDSHTTRVPRYEVGQSLQFLGRVVLTLNRGDL